VSLDLFPSLTPSLDVDLNVSVILTANQVTFAKTSDALKSQILATHHLVVLEQLAWSTMLEILFAGKIISG